MGLGYRVGQFWRLWTIKELPADARAEVTAVLTPSQWQLYSRFSPGDQWHSYQAWRTLQQAGHSQPDLQVAALLHDVGKTQVQLTLWERTLIVLTEKLLPQKLAVWGQGDAQGWKRPFVVKAQHPAWGAEMAAAAGCTPLTVSLIRRHQDKMGDSVTSEDQLLRLLQWADDQN